MSQYTPSNISKVTLLACELTESDLTMSKFRHSFLGILTKHFPTTILAPALKSYLRASFTHNAIVDTSSPPPFIEILRVLQLIGLASMMERELSVVVAEKVREFINIEAKGDWGRRYTTILSEWVDNGLAELLRFILGRKERESVGEDALKTIALRALTDLRYDLHCWRMLILALMSYLILSRSFLSLHQRLKISRYVLTPLINAIISSTYFVKRISLQSFSHMQLCKTSSSPWCRHSHNNNTIHLHYQSF